MTMMDHDERLAAIHARLEAAPLGRAVPNVAALRHAKGIPSEIHPEGRKGTPHRKRTR